MIKRILFQNNKYKNKNKYNKSIHDNKIKANRDNLFIAPEIHKNNHNSITI